MANENLYDAVDVMAIKSSGILTGLAAQGIVFDGNDDGSIFFQRELDVVKQRTYDVKHPRMTGLDLIHVSHETNPGAESITYYSYDKTGYAQIINNYATDLPRVDIKGVPHTSSVVSIGASYGYSMQDIRASKLADKHLDQRRGEAARFVIDKKINELVFVGDSEHNVIGLLSTNNNIPVYTLSQVTSGGSQTTSWSAKTADEIVADLIGMISAQAESTADVESPNAIALPPSVVRELTVKRIEGTDVSVWKYIKENLPSIKKWIECPELEARSTSTNPYGKRVLIVFNDSEEKASFEIPMAFYQYPAQPKNLEIQVNCEARVGGLILYYPMAFVIAAGI